MMITSFFTNNGIPAVGLTPTVRVWEVSDATDNIVVSDAPMHEIGGGFYKFLFATYDNNRLYMYRCDGGPTLSSGERYQAGSNETFSVNNATIVDVVNGVWDEDATNHMRSGTTGEKLATVKADTTLLTASILTVSELLHVLFKYESNRSLIDASSKTLTIFDDDGVTPMQVFELRDKTGALSVDEVYERVPK